MSGCQPEISDLYKIIVNTSECKETASQGAWPIEGSLLCVIYFDLVIEGNWWRDEESRLTATMLCFPPQSQSLSMTHSLLHCTTLRLPPSLHLTCVSCELQWRQVLYCRLIVNELREVLYIDHSCFFLTRPDRYSRSPLSDIQATSGSVFINYWLVPLNQYSLMGPVVNFPQWNRSFLFQRWHRHRAVHLSVIDARRLLLLLFPKQNFTVSENWSELFLKSKFPPLKWRNCEGCEVWKWLFHTLKYK